MTDRPANGRWLRWVAAAVVVIGCAAGGAYWWYLRNLPNPEPDPALRFPLPAYTKSRYLNTAPDAGYIGTAACAGCHRSNHQTYLHTAHSRSLGDVDPNAEPADGTFEHPATGKSYRVYRTDNEMRHAESVRGEDGKDIVVVDLPVRYLMGSGNFARTYVVEVEGHLHQSPITYYPAIKKWGLSPGYDGPQNFGFERPIKIECIFCHAGRTEVAPGSVNRMTFKEKSIGCESCHGPGGLHEKLQRSQKTLPGEDDVTIVNPGKLPRALQEDICASCHLTGQAFVHLRGRTHTDFRPGMPLSNYRIHFAFENKGNAQMTVVGHVEQLRLSACYQKSAMTCLTCHDPHKRPDSKDSIAFYRQKCLECHDGGSGKPECRLDPAERRKKSPVDNCASCHMPRGDTEIPHIAFTHHRIGRHRDGKQPPVAPSPLASLAPIENVQHLSSIDRDRNLGLALLMVAKDRAAPDPDLSKALRLKGVQALHFVHGEGLRDATTVTALSDYYFLRDPARAASFASEVLELNDAPADSRGTALWSLTVKAMRDRDMPAAIKHLNELNTIYRNPEVPFYLGVCYLEQKQPDKAIAAFQQAIARRPFPPDTHRHLAEAYRQTGNERLANEHVEKAEKLLKAPRN